MLEDGTRTRSEQGTPQGGSASPLLANIYLHYVFDLWVRRWRQTQARGEVIVVRYADDIVVGFRHRSDAERFRAELTERFSKFALELHPDKTRLIEFGPFAAENRQRRGQGKPETFDFLGFTRHHGASSSIRRTPPQARQACYGRDQPVNDSDVTDQPATVLTVVMARHHRSVEPHPKRGKLAMEATTLSTTRR